MCGTLYTCILINFLVCFWHFNMVLGFLSLLFIPCFGYAYQMDFYGFVDGAFHHTLNLASTAWVLSSQTHDLVSSGAVCIGPTTNNIVVYHDVIGLLTETASRDIDHLVVFMDC